MKYNMPLVTPNDDGIRPNKPNKCFYCNQSVGQPHMEKCVAIHRKVKVRYSLELEIEVPWGWEEENILFHRMDGTWCAHNAIKDLKEYSDSLGECECLCQGFNCEVIEIPDVAPYGKIDEEVTDEVH